MGIAQFFSPPGAFINRYAWSTSSGMEVALMGDKARITGTFTFITPYTYYLQFMFLAGLALFSLQENGKKSILLGAGVGLVLINIVMSGSRAPLLISIACAVPFLSGVMRRTLAGRGRIFKLIIPIMAGSVLLFVFANSFSMLEKRNKEAGDFNERVSGAFLTPIYMLEHASFDGTGIGSTFMGVQELSQGQKEALAGFSDVTDDRIGIETGTPGYLFVLFFKLLFIFKTWSLYRRVTERRLKTWALVSLCYQVSLLWAIPVYQSVAAAFYFTSLGMYFMLRKEAGLKRVQRAPMPSRFGYPVPGRGIRV